MVSIPPPPGAADAEDVYRLAPLEPALEPPPQRFAPHVPPAPAPAPPAAEPPLTPPPVQRTAHRMAPLPEAAQAAAPPVEAFTPASLWQKQSLALRHREAVRRAGQPRFWLFAATLLPLALSILIETSDTHERLERTFRAHPDAAAELQRAGSLDAALAVLPGQRIEGALLPRDSQAHWLYAAAASLFFFSLILLLFDPGNALLPHWVGVGLATSTVGIFLLICLQLAAAIGERILPGGGPSAIVFQVLGLIGFSYRAALDPANGFLLSLLGFTLGVGLCEELTKALPLLLRVRSARDFDWRAACVWGLASGVGFGVAEGVMYSADYYNGIASGNMYVVRFVSCVALHAIWAAAMGILLAHLRNALGARPDWRAWGVGIVKVFAVPILLHGLYDTLLKRELNAAALLVAAMSFAWLGWLIQQAVLRERRAYQSLVRGWA